MLALGRQIVNELQLDARGSVVTRWLAHHIAELIQLAESSGGTAKIAAQKRAVTAILKLWAERRNIPADIDPLNGYRRAIEVLGRLAPDANPWSRYRGSGQYEDLLSQIFDALRMTVLAGVLLTQVDRPRPIRLEEVPFVEAVESELHAALAGWIPFLTTRPRPRPPKINVVFVPPDSEQDILKSDELGPASITMDAHPTSAAEVNGNDDPASIATALLSHLEAAHEDMGKLIARWKKAAAVQPNETDSSRIDEPDESGAE